MPNFASRTHRFSTSTIRCCEAAAAFAVECGTHFRFFSFLFILYYDGRRSVVPKILHTHTNTHIHIRHSQRSLLQFAWCARVSVYPIREYAHTVTAKRASGTRTTQAHADRLCFAILHITAYNCCFFFTFVRSFARSYVLHSYSLSIHRHR